MKHLELVRFAHLPEGVLGELNFPSGLKLFTIERPWLENKPFVSCIPAGVYQLEWDTTGRIKNVPRLVATQPRTQINIHVANWARELHGCIAPGLDWGINEGVPSVTNSRHAMDLFLEQIEPAIGADKSKMVWSATPDDGRVVLHIVDALTIQVMDNE